MIKPTKLQSEAIKKVKAWTKNRQLGRIFTLAGFAGTGKTTILQFIVEDIKPRNLILCAPTGKAASVLSSKLKKNVRTVHKVLYCPRGQSLKELEKLEAQLAVAREEGAPTVDLLLEIAAEKERLAAEDNVHFDTKPIAELNDESIVICDEASMVSDRMKRDFEETGARVLYVGDPGQLPPVKESSWFIDYQHDVMLTEILRQALDSPIIRLSMEIRAGEVDVKQYKEGDCRIMRKDKVDIEEWVAADQILTGANESRRRINRFMRKKLGHDGHLPHPGERLICLKNCYDHIPQFINGVQCLSREEFSKSMEGIEARITYEGSAVNVPFYDYHVRSNYLEGLKELPRDCREGLFEADYAYAITVHKSQGSEWDNVVVADDQMQKNAKEFRQRWLYTAVTRAKKKLTIVQ